MEVALARVVLAFATTLPEKVVVPLKVLLSPKSVEEAPVKVVRDFQ